MQVYGHAASMGTSILLVLCMLDGQHLAASVSKAGDATSALLGCASLRFVCAPLRPL